MFIDLFVEKPILGVGDNKMYSKEEIKEEDQRLRYLQILVSLAVQTLREGSMTVQEGYDLIESTRLAALKLFPGKELAFQLIYEPRLLRALRERWGTEHMH